MDPALQERPHVAVWRDKFAPYSQTFIFDELRHHTRYQATVFTERRINAHRFPYNDVVALNQSAPALQLPHYWLTNRSSLFDSQLRRRNFSLIHAHFGTSGVRALPYALRHRLPLITSFHGKDFAILFGGLSGLPWHWHYRAYGKRLLERCTLLLAASGALRNALVKEGCREEKIELFQLGIDLTKFSRKRKLEKRLHVVMVGRLVEKKGFKYALRAIGELGALRSQIRVTVIGSGPRNRELQRLTSQLGLTNIVTFLGALQHASVAEVISDADIIMAPSVTTRLGDQDSGIIAVKEAAASAVPCIGTLHGGLPEIVEHGRTGFLVNERDVAGLCRHLRELLASRDLRDAMGEAARRKMLAEYDIRTANDRLEAIYDRVIRQSTPPNAIHLHSQTMTHLVSG